MLSTLPNTKIKQIIPIKMQIPMAYAKVSECALSAFTKVAAKFRIKPKMIPVAVTSGCLKDCILSSIIIVNQ